MKTAEPDDKKQLLRADVELIDLANEFEYSFRKNLERRIKRAWFPPSRRVSTEPISIDFEIMQDGSINNLRITKSSDIGIADLSAQRAIEHLAPVANLERDTKCTVNFSYKLWKV